MRHSYSDNSEPQVKHLVLTNGTVAWPMGMYDRIIGKYTCDIGKSYALGCYVIPGWKAQTLNTLDGWKEEICGNLRKES